MKISKIKVKNFRSIKEAEIAADNFNVFVGQNNHGKTNFFEAIDWFYYGKGDIDKIRFGRSGDEEVSVEIEFIEIQDGIEKMRNEKNRKTMGERFGTQDTLRARRINSSKVRQIYDDTKEEWIERNPTGFDSAFNDFLPSFEYVNTDMKPTDMMKYGKGTPIANMLAGVLSVILSKDPAYTRFVEEFEKLFTDDKSQMRMELDKLSGKVKVYLGKQFPDCEEVVFEVAQPAFEDLLKKFETSIDDGVHTSADEKGDGMQRALMLAIIQAYADFRRENEETNKYFLFLIDEGELHLHPTAQRNLKNALLELAAGGDQVFINTHSSVLVVDDHPHQTIFKVEKTDKQTSIAAIGEAEKPYVVYELLGGSPADLLLPKNFLVVEGKSDLEFLTRVITRHYSERPQIQIIPADGDISQAQRSFSAIEHIFKPINKSIYRGATVLYLDRQSDATRLNKFLNQHSHLQSNNQFFQASGDSIEECYPSPWQKTATEVNRMTGQDKLALAKMAGDGVSKIDFENSMPKAFEALNQCWALAYR